MGTIRNKLPNNIKYPDKLEKLKAQGLEGESLAIEYNRFIRSSSLKSLIEKHGEKEARRRHEEKLAKVRRGHSLEKYIEKYGPELGPIKHQEWIDKSRQTKVTFIARYGEEEGERKWNEFVNINKEHSSVYRSKKTAEGYNCTLEYYLKKTNGDVELAKQLLHERQSMTKSRFSKLYGEEDGEKRWDEYCKSKGLTLENLISKYGEIEGPKRYRRYNKLRELAMSPESMIERHGEDWYIDLLIRKTESISKSSDIATELFESVYEELNDEVKSSSKIYFDSEKYKKSEYKFYMHDGYSKIISVDFYLKDKNKVVEFYGDYWHKNPKYYSEDDEKVKDVHLWDELRILRLKEKYGVDILIIWEDEYRRDKISVVNKVINYLNS